VNTTGNTVSERYSYGYDALNRITSATDNTGHYNLVGILYDKNGNIGSLERKGHTAVDGTGQVTSFAGSMDDLDYGYFNGGASNRLYKVRDDGSDGYGFKDGTGDTQDYWYDANGNLTRDLNKGIGTASTDGIEYNHLNLPTKIEMGSGDISYVYDAAGTKIQKTVSTGSSVTDYAGNYIYQGGTLQFFGQPEGYVTPDGQGGYDYVYQYKDHLGNIRLSYVDDGNGGLEIVEENNYYPFGLKHKGYNDVPMSSLGNDVAQKWKFGGVELDETTGLYEMGFRQYDAAIGRFTAIDPVTHFNQSTYTAFDNNPVYYADPSGTTTVSSIQEAWDATPENGSSTWNSNGEGGFCDDCLQEGQRRTEMVPHINALDGMESYTYENQIYHSGGVGGLGKGWTTEDKYFEAFRTTIRSIGQGQASIEILGTYNFTDDVLLAMVGWASQAYDYYGGQVPKESGAITPLSFLDFMPAKLGVRALTLRNLGKMSFWSGRGTEAAARRAGFMVLGQTRAGKNMIKLTAGMNRSQSGPFWDRLSGALARSYKPGSTANVHITRSAAKNASSTWNRIERPILEANNVKIKYNWVD